MATKTKFAQRLTVVDPARHASEQYNAVLENQHCLAAVCAAFREKTGIPVYPAERPGLFCMISMGNAGRKVPGPYQFDDCGLAILVNERTLDTRIYSFQEPFNTHVDPGLPTPVHTDMFSCNLAGCESQAEIVSNLETVMSEMKQIDFLTGLDRT